MSNRPNVGVIFDMDGVLVDSARPHLLSWQRLAEEIGGSVTEAHFTATFGRQNNDIVPELFGPVTDNRLRELGDRKEEIYRELIRDHPPIVTGAVELVRALRDAGVSLAVGSSGPMANVALVLDAMGVRDLIRVIVSGDDATRGKPDPEVFLLACAGLRLAPRRCVVVEDAPAGVAAARAAGARCVAVLRHHPAEAFDGADCIVPRLADLTVARLLGLVDPSASAVSSPVVGPDRR